MTWESTLPWRRSPVVLSVERLETVETGKVSLLSGMSFPQTVALTDFFLRHRQAGTRTPTRPERQVTGV
jgi:hypothetical protein